jgi:hypothetical protein
MPITFNRVKGLSESESEGEGPVIFAIAKKERLKEGRRSHLYYSSSMRFGSVRRLGFRSCLRLKRLFPACALAGDKKAALTNVFNHLQ